MASGKFHISNDGNVRACRAKSEDSCTAKGLGGRHFDSAEEGREAVEKILGGSPTIPSKKKTRKEKLDEAVVNARNELAAVDKVHKRKLKEFSNVEAEIKKVTLSGGNTPPNVVADYTRLQAEIAVLSEERSRLNKAYTQATREREAEAARTRPAPVYTPSAYHSGGCGGGRGC